MGVTGGRVFTIIIPWLDWFWKFRIEYIAIPASAILTLAIADIIFKNAMHKTVLKIFYGISAAFILLFLFLDTVVMRDWLDIAFGVYGAAILWLFGCLTLRHWKNQEKLGQKVYSTEQKMFGVGLILFIVAAVVDLGYVTAFFYMPNFHMTGVAVLVFALCEAAAVFTATMKQQQYLEAEKSALESLSRMKSKYLADMSHETKTPLAAMALHIQQAEILYKDENGQNETIINSLQRAQEIVKRVTRLSENARNLASMQENKERMKPIPTAEFLRDSTEHYKAFLKKNGNVLALEISDRLPPILGNKDELEQVLTNLLTNAGEYTKNGKITVRGEFAEQFVIVSVTDNGAGIEPKILPRIFERGVLGENSTGMGIGLAICKDFIENHGGAITAESEQGKGTTITFTLPVYKDRRQK
jgi:signal transduction histidine kinase